MIITWAQISILSLLGERSACFCLPRSSCYQPRQPPWQRQMEELSEAPSTRPLPIPHIPFSLPFFQDFTVDSYALPHPSNGFISAFINITWKVNFHKTGSLSAELLVLVRKLIRQQLPGYPLNLFHDEGGTFPSLV